MPFETQKENDSESPEKKAQDRKLGDEWEDWDGTPEGDIDEPKARFIWLASFVFVIFLGLLVLGAYLVYPRLGEWSPYLSWPLKAAFGVLLVGSVGVYLLFLMEVATGASRLLPYRWSETLLLWLLPKSVWLGGKLGFSRDQVFNSFIKVNNVLSRSHTRPGGPRRLLVLLPRCLSRETRQEIRRIMEGRPHALATAGGGEEARKAIRKERPDFIIALACERDLASGIKDVALHVPVIGIPNKRPEGPCKNTQVDIEEFRQALEFFERISKEQYSSSSPESS
jgi:hypothetical protein